MNGLDLIYMGAAGLTLPIWARKPRQGWPERFGKIQPLVPAQGKRLLIHAVSVGEVNALRQLVPHLVDKLDLVIASTTDTGIKRARELFAEQCTVVRYPLDFSRSVKRFLDAVRPDAVALVELEIWPNFVKQCDRRGIPVCVINGRLSERSFKGYRRIRPVIRPSFSRLAFAAVQDDDYAMRFGQMGVPADRCRVSGSMKWDAAKLEQDVSGAAQLASELGIDQNRPLIVAGSTGPGEETLLHSACPAGVQLLCAPRKPERFDEAARAMPGCVRWSQRHKQATGDSPADRFILDTIGLLRAAYSLADLVVVGRSFGKLYGSDPIEPIALDKATLIGPAMGDFANIVAELKKGDGLLVTGPEDLGADLARLIADAARRRELAERGKACILEHQGASLRHAEMLLDLVG